MSIDKKVKSEKERLILPQDVDPKNTDQVIAFFKQNYEKYTPEEEAEIDKLTDEYMRYVLDRFGMRKPLFFKELDYLKERLSSDEYEIVLIGFMKQETDFAKSIAEGPCSPFRKLDYGRIVHQPYWLEQRMKYLRETGKFTKKK